MVARGRPTQHGAALCRTYYMDHIQHWRLQPGAIEFVRSKETHAYQRATNPASVPRAPRSDTETYEEAKRHREAAERVNVAVKRCDWFRV